jgi:hypothetical protein
MSAAGSSPFLIDQFRNEMSSMYCIESPALPDGAEGGINPLLLPPDLPPTTTACIAKVQKDRTMLMTACFENMYQEVDDPGLLMSLQVMCALSLGLI